MNKYIEKAYFELVKVVRRNSPKTAVAVDIFITNGTAELNYRFESPEGLKYNKVSMRNLAGEWIE